MVRSKAVSALALLLLAPLLSTPQNAPSSSPAATTEKSFVPPLYLDKGGDVDKWVKAHESFLQRGDLCALSMSIVDGDFRSGLIGIADFMVAPANPDKFEENSFAIHDSESGLDVRVGARYIQGEGIEELEIALAFDGDPDNVFNEISSATANSLRDKNWKNLKLTRTIKIKTVRYEYYLGCWNGKNYLAEQRKFDKRMKHHKHSAY